MCVCSPFIGRRAVLPAQVSGHENIESIANLEDQRTAE